MCIAKQYSKLHVNTSLKTSSARSSCFSKPLPGMTMTSAIWLTVLVAALSFALVARAKTSSGPVLYGYRVLRDYHHDHAAYTQGLVYDRRCADPSDSSSCYDAFWESTGLYGKSSVREVKIETGEVVHSTSLSSLQFGEGLAKVNDRLIQMLWRTGQVNNWDLDLTPVTSGLPEETPLNDGWGLTFDGKYLIGSDGSDTLTFMDPKSLETKRQISVKDGDREVSWINELEAINGEIWANVYQTECVARIDPSTGAVRGWVLFHGLLRGMREYMKANQEIYAGAQLDVLNGIAYDAEKGRIFVTGKNWPRVLEVAVAPLKGDHLAAAEKAYASCFPKSRPLKL